LIASPTEHMTISYRLTALGAFRPTWLWDQLHCKTNLFLQGWLTENTSLRVAAVKVSDHHMSFLLALLE
jgi:hypothetical protein